MENLKFYQLIIICIYEINIENLTKNKSLSKKDFFNYFLNLKKNSHVLIQFSFNFLICIISFFYFFFLIFILKNNFKKILLKKIIKFLQKIIIFGKIFKVLKVYSLIYYYG